MGGGMSLILVFAEDDNVTLSPLSRFIDIFRRKPHFLPGPLGVEVPEDTRDDGAEDISALWGLPTTLAARLPSAFPKLAYRCAVGGAREGPLIDSIRRSRDEDEEVASATAVEESKR